VSPARVAAVARSELVVSLRNGEQLLLVLGLPLLFLVLFSTVDVLPTGTDEPVQFLAPGIVALAVLSGSFVRLAIGTGFDRSFGALRRFAVTPLRRGELLAAKVTATVVLLVVQLAVLVAAALLLGWRPEVAPAVVVGALVLGVVAFTGLGFLLAGVVDGLTALAAANAVYVVLLVLSGLVFELDRLPGFLQALARALPSTALGELLRSGLAGAAGPGRAWLVLAAWAALAPLAAVRWFRWE
jgi:ABC-2 type transport system permease protein